MGGSRGVLLSGIALIIGIYSVGIKKADVQLAGSAIAHACKIQSERNAMMGVKAGIHSLRSDGNGGFSGINTTDTFIILNDTVSYTVSVVSFATTGTITATSKFKNWKTTIRAYVRKKFGSDPYYWEITRRYIVPDPNEANYVYQ